MGAGGGIGDVMNMELIISLKRKGGSHFRSHIGFDEALHCHFIRKETMLNGFNSVCVCVRERERE